MINNNFSFHNLKNVFKISSDNLTLNDNRSKLSNHTYKQPEAKNVDEYFDMGSIEIEIDGEADPEMVMAEVKEIIEERKRRLEGNNG